MGWNYFIVVSLGARCFFHDCHSWEGLGQRSHPVFCMFSVKLKIEFKRYVVATSLSLAFLCISPEWTSLYELLPGLDDVHHT